MEQSEFIKAHGYISEVHKIVTEDGYILVAHRIANPGKQPVILTHGILDASTTYVLMGPKRSLGKINRPSSIYELHILFSI